MFNKKAQIGETVTWVVATIIIIVILTVSIFIVSSTTFSNSKKLELKNIHTDLLVTKSLLGYLLTENNFNELKEKNSALVDPTKGNFEESHVEFSQKIFGLNNGLYNKEYPDHFWMGIVEDFYVYNPIGEHGSGQPITSQFGNRLGKSQGSENFYYDRIKLNDKEHKSEDIFLELILIKFTKP